MAAVALMVGFAGGYFFYSSTMARYDAITAVCVPMNKAVELNMLTTEQVRHLGDAAGPVLRKSYDSVAGKLLIPEGSAENASKDSVCSQYLVGVNAGK